MGSVLEPEPRAPSSPSFLSCFVVVYRVTQQFLGRNPLENSSLSVLLSLTCSASIPLDGLHGRKAKAFAATRQRREGYEKTEGDSRWRRLLC